MRGDINATELYQDREFLTRVGMGIYDIEFGSNGNVGFEDVFKFSYVENEEEDPKSRIVAMSFCEPRSCRLQLSS